MVMSSIAHRPAAAWLGCARLPHGAEGRPGGAAELESLVQSRAARLLLLAFGLFGLWSLAAPQASAQAAETLRGRVFNEQEVDGERVRDPVEGVVIVITGP